MTVEPGCYTEVRNARTVDADSSAAQSREKCGICFTDGEIPDSVDEVVVGRHTAKVHLTEEYEPDYEATLTPDNPSCSTEGLAAKIGAEDFGPEDLEEFPTSGGDA